MSSTVGLRERKKADTRAAISRAALRLAIEHGPDAITVDDIAAAADVSPRTVFNYFATKEEAILGFDPNRNLEVGRSVLERPARESPLTTLRAAFVEIATGVPEVAEISRARVQLVRDHPQLHPSYVAGTPRSRMRWSTPSRTEPGSTPSARCIPASSCRRPSPRSVSRSIAPGRASSR